MVQQASAKNKPTKDEKTQMDGKVEDLPDFSKWTAHQIGFAPYWRASKPGDWCYMKVVNIDVRNLDFIRYQCTAMKDTECRRGPGNDDEKEGLVGEVVTVQKGEAFTISVYHSLREEFDFFRYLRKDHDIDVPMRLTAVKKVPTKHPDGRKVWNWELLSDPAERKKIEAHRDTFLKLTAGINEETEREQLQE